MSYKWVLLEKGKNLQNTVSHICLKKIDDIVTVNVYPGDCRVSVNFKHDDYEYFVTEEQKGCTEKDFIFEFLYDAINKECSPHCMGSEQGDSILQRSNMADQEFFTELFRN